MQQEIVENLSLLIGAVTIGVITLMSKHAKEYFASLNKSNKVAAEKTAQAVSTVTEEGFGQIKTQLSLMQNGTDMLVFINSMTTARVSSIEEKCEALETRVDNLPLEELSVRVANLEKLIAEENIE